MSGGRYLLFLFVHPLADVLLQETPASGDLEPGQLAGLEKAVDRPGIDIEELSNLLNRPGMSVHRMLHLLTLYVGQASIFMVSYREIS
jgi:hypothetical protein